MKAIDVHGHYGIHNPRGRTGLETEMRSATIEEVCRRARQVEICLTVVSPLQAFHPYGGKVLEANKDACEQAESCDEVRFWAVLDPRSEPTYKQVEELLGHSRCKGIKIHPVNHSYEIRDYGDEIFAFAAEHQAVVLTHSGCPLSFPEDFIPFADKYRQVVLILAHLGNSADGNLARQVYALQKAEGGNVYIDTSSIKSMTPGLVEWAVREVGAERLLFGSDSPVYFTACQKARIEYAEIEEAAKRAILYENAARLLGEELAVGIG